MAGSRPVRTTSPRHSWNAGRRTVREPRQKPPRKTLGLTKTAGALLRQLAQHGFLKLSSGPTGSLFATVHAVAEHLGHDLFTAQKVNLKAVSLFLSPGLGIDAPDIL